VATRMNALVQTAAELYIESQVVARRSRTDARFTEAQQRAALAELARLCGNTAALLKQIAAQKNERPR